MASTATRAGRRTSAARAWALAAAIGLLAPWFPNVHGDGADGIAPIYHKDRSFRIPFDLGDKDLSRIKELQLWYSEDDGYKWDLASRVSPDQSAFTFRARTDGEYWFAVRTLSVSGQYSPSKDEKVKPALKVIVDTVRPQLVLESHGRQGSTARVRWEVKDENLDLSTLRLEYQAPGAREWASVPVKRPAALGSQSWDARTVDTIRVRASIADKAGNVAEDETELSEGASEAPDLAMLDPESNSAPPVRNRGRSNPQIQANHGFTPVDEDVAAPAPRAGTAAWNGDGRGITRQTGAGSNSMTEPPPAADWNRGQGNSTFAPGSAFGEPSKAFEDAQTPAPMNQSAFPEPYPNQPGAGSAFGAAPTAAPPPQEGAASGTMLVSNPRFKLQYAVDDAGPGGPAKVQLWVTRDGGRSWGLAGEDDDRISPIDVDLGGEGTFGVSLVALSSSNLGDRPPAPGDPPQTWVKVDSTPPVVQLFPPEIGAGVHAGKVAITWRSNDLNLAPRPVSILWRPDQPGESWQTIVDAQEPNGQFIWTVPQNFPPKLHIRVEAADAAGNRGHAETPESAPVIVDRSRPRSRIIGLDPNARTGDGPNASSVR